MKKKIIGLIIVVITIALVIFGLTTKKDFSKLEEYKLLSDEAIQKEFEYKGNQYVLTSYHKSDSTYAYNNLLMKNKNKYYFLEEINKCDMSYFIKDNEIYIHCIGKKGDILKYRINRYEVSSETINLNYSNTPNTSQIHLTVDNVDENNIYLKSAVKVNDSIKDGENIICSLKTNNCKYN